jgi:hypothetical protein
MNQQNSVTYRNSLNPWAIVRLLPNSRWTIVGHYRNRSDADGQVKCLKQQIPQGLFVVVFDGQRSLENLPN